MRDVPATVQTYLDKNTGTDPIITVDINWNGIDQKYSDRVKDGYDARIISISDIDSAVSLSGSTSTQQVTIELEDSDGQIKDILNAVDVYNRPLTVYLSFESSARMLLFEGAITTPVKWSDGDRSVTINALTVLNTSEAGFSIDEVDEDYNDEIEGVAWPFIFGNVCWSNVLQIKTAKVATLGSDILDDTSSDYEALICQASYLPCGDLSTTVITKEDYEANLSYTGYTDAIFYESYDSMKSYGVKVIDLETLLENTAAGTNTIYVSLLGGISDVCPAWIDYTEDFDVNLVVNAGIGLGSWDTFVTWLKDPFKYRTFVQRIVTYTSEVNGVTVTSTKGACVLTQVGGTGKKTEFVINDVTYNLVVDDANNRVLLTTPNASCVQEYQQRICELEYTLDYLKEHGTTSFYLNDETGNFPRNEEVKIEVHGLIVTGILDDSSLFTITGIVDPLTDTGETHDLICEDPGTTTKVTSNVESIDEWVVDYTGWYRFLDNHPECSDFTLKYGEEGSAAGIAYETEAEAAWDLYSAMALEVLGNINSASTGESVYDVTDDSEANYIYMVSMVPGTVTGSAAYYLENEDNDSWIISDLSSNSETEVYTIKENDYGQFQDCVEFQIPRSSILSTGDKWDEQPYISFSSDVGPNGADVIKWIIETFTDLSVDEGTFDTVRDLIGQMPVNFVYQDKKSALTLAAEIAEQLNCALFTSANVIKIVSLREEPTSVLTVDASNCLKGSFAISLSESAELYTKITANWSPSAGPLYKDDDASLSVVRTNNIDNYGTIKLDMDYFAFNQRAPVVSSVKFWLNRKSNIWKMATFRLPFKYIYLEPFDCVYLDKMSTKAVITNISPMFSEGYIEVECWTPIKSGSSVPDEDAWPGNDVGTMDPPLCVSNNQFDGMVTTEADENETDLEALALEVAQLSSVGSTTWSQTTSSSTPSSDSDSDDESDSEDSETGVDEEDKTRDTCKYYVTWFSWDVYEVCGRECGIGLLCTRDPDKMGSSAQVRKAHVNMHESIFSTCEAALSFYNGIESPGDKKGCVWMVGDEYVYNKYIEVTGHKTNAKGKREECDHCSAKSGY